jgi:hypothetical protein
MPGEKTQPVGRDQERASLVADHRQRERHPDGEGDDDEEEHPPDAEVDVLTHDPRARFPRWMT